MVLLLAREFSGAVKPIYVVTDVESDKLKDYWDEDDSSENYVFRKKFRTIRGLSRFLKKYFKAEM